MNKITDFEKRIYNCYLKNMRRGQPYRPRVDFSGMDSNDTLSLVKLSAFFNSYPNIDIEAYFEAPNELYKDEKYPPLKAFIGRMAIKTYSMYQKQKQDRNPESQFEEIRNSFRYIGLFCVENKISLNQYLHHKTGYIYAWLDHYRQNKVNPYALFGIGNIIQIMSEIPRDERDLFAQNLEEKLISYWNRYQKSPKTKKFVEELIKKVSTFIQNELTTP